MSALKDCASFHARLSRTAEGLAADLSAMIAAGGTGPTLAVRLALAHALALTDQLAELQIEDTAVAVPATHAQSQ